jgi:hypothetical protein
MDLSLLAPFGLLLAVGIVPALVALFGGERRAGRARDLLGLRSPGRAWTVTSAGAVCLAGALLALAASRPVVRENHSRYLRTDAEAIFAIDISRSMLAAGSAAAPTRIARAKQAAERLRAAIPDVPAGVASFTDRVLPNLFPTPDAATFDATVERSIGIERPPPGGNALTVTTFDALAPVSTDAYFTPGSSRRVLVILSDAESVDFSLGLVRRALGPQSGVRTVLVRIGSTREHVYGREGLPEAGFHAEPTTQIVNRFVDATGGRAFGEGDLGAAAAAIRADVGHGRRVRTGSFSSSTDIGRYLVLAAALPLGFLIRRRNLR